MFALTHILSLIKNCKDFSAFVPSNGVRGIAVQQRATPQLVRPNGLMGLYPTPLWVNTLCLSVSPISFLMHVQQDVPD